MGQALSEHLKSLIQMKIQTNQKGWILIYWVLVLMMKNLLISTITITILVKLNKISFLITYKLYLEIDDGVPHMLQFPLPSIEQRTLPPGTIRIIITFWIFVLTTFVLGNLDLTFQNTLPANFDYELPIKPNHDSVTSYLVGEDKSRSRFVHLNDLSIPLPLSFFINWYI